MKVFARLVIMFASAFLLASLPERTFAADAYDESGAATAAPALQEIIVTARKREENLQDVPDAVTVLTAATLQNANVQTFGDFAVLVPNLNFQDGSSYQVGFFNASMRGIGNGQQGWPAVAFIVDGVPADSPDALTSSSLLDIEQIEVLRGPQSALYGANAIAGAINVVTKRPTNDTDFESRLSYGNGNDRQVDGAISGALIPDKLLVRFSAQYRDFGGLIDSASNGLPLDFRDHKQFQGRVIFDPTSNFEADIRGSYVQDHNGSTYQDLLPSAAYINDFNPIYDARRMTPGTDDRTFSHFSARLKLDLQPFSIIAVSSYDRGNESGWVSICYDDPNDPLYPRQPDGGIVCLSGTEAYGSAARPGQAIDNIFYSLDRYTSYTEDVRLESRDDSAVHWLVGASGMQRDALDGFDTLNVIAPNKTLDVLFPEWDVKRDRWWGAYGQASVKVQEVWEFTFAARFDDQQYENTAYTDSTLTTVAPVYSTGGVLIPTQMESATAFQPKGQISYHIDSDRMVYATVSRGFRAGYFSTGAYALPEHTTNYELGLKSEWLEHRLSNNIAVFHIDYSDQQTSNTVATPPYRIPITIPQTGINGAEWETTAIVTSTLTLSTGLAYLDARVTDGTRSPGAPLTSGSLSAQLLQPLTAGWRLNARADFIFHSAEYLEPANTEGIPGKTFLNLRAGLEKGGYGIYGYGRNVTNTREATIFGGNVGTRFARDANEPAVYGVELRVKF